MKKDYDPLDAMLGKEFLEEIDAEDANHILEALKKYGNNDLIDKWVSVKIIASTVRGTKKRKVDELNWKKEMELRNKTLPRL